MQNKDRKIFNLHSYARTHTPHTPTTHTHTRTPVVQLHFISS